MRTVLLAIFMLFTVELYAVRPPAITTTKLVSGQTGVAYSVTLKAKWGTKPYTWSVSSGSLPTGLALNAATGVISGVPTVAQTFSFVILLTDAGALTDTQQLYILISGTTPPPPSPAVQITTGTPLPSGLVGSAYTTTLQAVNGTLPYTWSVSAGAPPAGTTLNSATGVLSGTPTAPGTVSFSATVSDSSTTPGSATQPFSVDISNPVPAPTNIFEDGFEAGCSVASCQAITTPSGYFPAWSGFWLGTAGTYSPTVQNSLKHSGNYAYEQEYYICGDSTNSACGAAHQDLNRWVVKRTGDFGYPSGLTHFWVRAYVYIKAPEADATTGKIVQRKLIRISDGPLGTSSSTYEILLSGWSGSGGLPTSDTRLNLYYYNTAGVLTPIWGLGTLNYNTWYSLEEEIQLNTPSVADGIYRLYINGVLAYQSTTLDLRGAKSTNVTYFGFGAQVDRGTYFTVHEKRYWDDIVISTAYIGP